MFAIIRNAIQISGGPFTGGVYTGAIESKHRTAEAAERARERLNARCRRANGASTHLDLTIGEIIQEMGGGTHAQIKV